MKVLVCTILGITFSLSAAAQQERPPIRPPTERVKLTDPLAPYSSGVQRSDPTLGRAEELLLLVVRRGCRGDLPTP